MQATEALVAQLISEPWAYPGLQSRAANVIRLRLVTKDSLGPWICWSLFEVDRCFVARRIEWDRHLDIVRLPDEAPSTFGCDGLLPIEAALTVLAEAHQIALMSAPLGSGAVLDGSRWQFRLAMLTARPVALEWDACGPASAKLDSLFENCASKLDEFLPRSTVRSGESAA
jgi:hypothetical protein